MWTELASYFNKEHLDQLNLSKLGFSEDFEPADDDDMDIEEEEKPLTNGQQARLEELEQHLQFLYLEKGKGLTTKRDAREVKNKADQGFEAASEALKKVEKEMKETKKKMKRVPQF